MARLLGIRIRNFKALHDLELGQVEYSKGTPLPKFVCFIGPNGAGKSTLLDAFGFVADCLLEGVEAACDKPWRGGFERLRTQGSQGPIAIQLLFEDDDPLRPIVYGFAINLEGGVPVVTSERLQQRRKGESRGRLYYFLKLAEGGGKVWAGEFLGSADDPKATKVQLADLNRLGLSTLGNLSEHPRIVRLRAYIEQWYLSYFIPDAARKQPPSGAQRWLDREGANISNVLQYMQRAHPAQFDQIVAQLRHAIPGLELISVETSKDRRLLLKFNETGYADPFYQLSMSDGTLKMLAYALLLADPAPRPFIGIEEPENGLYIGLIEQLARQFASQTSPPGSPQIIVTTHSPYFVDALRPDQVWLMRKDERGRATATRAADVPNVPELVNQGIPLGAQWYSGHLSDSQPSGRASRRGASGPPRGAIRVPGGAVRARGSKKASGPTTRKRSGEAGTANRKKSSGRHGR